MRAADQRNQRQRQHLYLLLRNSVDGLMRKTTASKTTRKLLLRLDQKDGTSRSQKLQHQYQLARHSRETRTCFLMLMMNHLLVPMTTSSSEATGAGLAATWKAARAARRNDLVNIMAATNVSETGKDGKARERGSTCGWA